MATPGIIISAPTSGAGKTTITLGILRALRDKGLNVSAAKIGPDYIDLKFHERASSGRCVNLDSWGMNKPQLQYLASETSKDPIYLLLKESWGYLMAHFNQVKVAMARLLAWHSNSEYQ